MDFLASAALSASNQRVISIATTTARQGETGHIEPDFDGAARVCGYNSRLCKRRNVNRRKSDMPIYAYRCESCGFQKDALQKMSDAPLTHCPNCGKDTFRKQVTAAGFQLKGSGWYVTDFRGGNNGAPAAKKDDGSKSSEGKPETKPDSGAAKDSGSAGSNGDSGSGSASSTNASASASDSAKGSSAGPAPAAPSSTSSS
jgi:putative FmdB family regulatory protein